MPTENAARPDYSYQELRSALEHQKSYSYNPDTIRDYLTIFGGPVYPENVVDKFYYQVAPNTPEIDAYTQLAENQIDNGFLGDIDPVLARYIDPKRYAADLIAGDDFVYSEPSGTFWLNV